MKTVKFKKKKFNIKEKILITIIISFLLCTVITKYITSKMTENIINIADKIIKKENMLILKEAFSKKNLESSEVTELITVIKNSKEEIVEVDFNIAKCEKLMMNIIDHMNEATRGYNENGHLLFIPLGYLSNSPLLVNLGPKIPINAKTTDVIMGNVKTTIKEYGINNALVEIYLEIILRVDTILPLKKREQNIKYESLIASKIINGQIPSFYNGIINKESEKINLPIAE